MSDFRRPSQPRELTILRKHRESNTMLTIVMAGIAGLFIIAIAAVYSYATNTSVAQRPSPSVTSETTGSGSAERGVPAQPMRPSVGF